MIYVRSTLIKQDNKILCTECGETQLFKDNETGELVCQSCGLVVSSRELSTSPEWRAFDPNQQEKLTRVGAPMTWTIYDKGLSTNIGWQDLDVYGKKLNPETRTKFFRLRKWQLRSKVSDSRNRNLSIALNEMNNIQSKLNLPKSIIETSSILYRKALNANLIRGRTIQLIVVACIYMACRQCGVVRTLEDVAGSCNISQKDVARYYRFLYKELKLNIPQADPQNYIGKIVSKLSLNGETEKLAKDILREASLMKLTGGRGPAGMAAASIYLSTKITGDLRTQSNIAREAQVTEVTIRNRYKELFKHLQLEIQL